MRLQHTIIGIGRHLILFFAGNCDTRSNIVSYGQDIEAVWLMQEAAVIEEKVLLEEVKG